MKLLSPTDIVPVTCLSWHVATTVGRPAGLLPVPQAIDRALRTVRLSINVPCSGSHREWFREIFSGAERRFDQRWQRKIKRTFCNLLFPKSLGLLRWIKDLVRRSQAFRRFMYVRGESYVTCVTFKAVSNIDCPLFVSWEQHLLKKPSSAWNLTVLSSSAVQFHLFHGRISICFNSWQTLPYCAI